MRFENILSRMDEHSFKNLLEPQLLKLMKLLYKEPVNSSFYRNLIVNHVGAEKLLSTKRYRNLIIDLLRIDEAKLLCQLLNIDFSDPYTVLKNMNLKKGTDKELVFYRYFNVLPSKSSQEDNNFSRSDSETIATSNYEMFSHQRIAVKSTQLMLSKQPNRVLLHMPTGSGKTRTAMNVIAEHLRNNEPTVVVWLAASEELCQQAVEEFQKAWSYLGNRPIQVLRYWGENSFTDFTYNDCFLVAGLQKLVSKAKSEDGIDFISKLAIKSSLIIMDEAHQAIAPTYQSILDTLFYIGKNKKLLGLSATPGRTWNDIDSDAKLAKFFSKKKVKLEVEGYENPVDYLIEQGYLAEVQSRQLYYHNSNFSTSEIKMLSTLNDLPLHLLKKLGEDEQRNLMILYEIEKITSTHKRILVFAPSVESSNLLALMLRIRGYNAHSVTGETENQDRKRIITNFKNKEDVPKIICNYGVLTTGFDAPMTSAAIIARPTLSLVLYSQMIGRAIRGTKAGGNEFAEIITVVDQDLPGFSSVAESFNNWEDVWT
ncbi:DEAD/DEAH box helicase [Fictibacillus iocasae]|uniref:DEAD/DEAH box helicase n=1 Tax=Fictibacillus iocasae TaxID=2715437 RepID=A0ABW2NNH8_9BACL